jgi:transcriptional regulator of arginine metabolism
MTKNQRQHRIGELLEREVISTAAQLVARLQAEDIVATQATVTRDLQELGTIKVRDEHGSRRIVIAMAPKMTAAPLDHLRRMMGEWVVSVDYSANLVAGDDTVLVIAGEARGGASLAQEFRMLAGFSEPLVAVKKGT